MSAPSTKPPSHASEGKSPRSAPAKPVDAVPILDLQRQYEQVRAEVLQAVGRVCASQHYVLGPEVEEFERAMAEFCGAREAVGCSSGTDALWLALAAAGVQPGDRVLTTPFSFFASASAIVRSGARPVFADIEPGTFNLDPVKVGELLRSGGQAKTRAVLPVHLYGQCADIDSFQQLADEFRLVMVEDAAQAIGATWISATQIDATKIDETKIDETKIDETKIDATQIDATKIDAAKTGRRAGNLGAAAAFSFYPTKNLSAYGEAGLVTTSNPEMAAHMRRLRNHGSSRRYLHEEMGWNSRLDAMQAAILHVKLKYVEGWNQARRERAATYDRLFAEAGLARAIAPAQLTSAQSTTDQKSTIRNLQSAIAPDDYPIHLPYSLPRAQHVFHQYVIRAFRRDDLREFLTARKIGTEIYYPIPLHLQPCFAYLGYREGDFPEAERAAKEVLALPMFPELTEEEQRWVAQSIADFYC